MPVADFAFPYHIRKSRKAKNLGIKITEEKGVEVVCPVRISDTKALDFLKAHETWVYKHAKVWQATNQPMTLPTTIVFPAAQETWPVVYETNLLNKKTRGKLLQRPDKTVVYLGANDTTLMIALLKKWCQQRAAAFLATRLKTLSDKTGLFYRELIFRTQRTCWGSCSEHGMISLNTKLMFCDSALVDYVLIHELAHTVHLDHSPAFWQLVEHIVPDYKVRKGQLHKAIIPQWFLRALR